MNVDERLKTIDAARGESLTESEKRQGQYDCRRQAYRKASRAARGAAGNDEASELANWIEARIREDGRLPRSREVRQKEADVVRENGRTVSTGSWIGALSA